MKKVANNENQIKKVTKKELTQMVYTSIDAFGKEFTIDTYASQYSDKFNLFAIKLSMSNKIDITFQGKTFTTFCNSDSNKKDFVDAIYEAIK